LDEQHLNLCLPCRVVGDGKFQHKLIVHGGRRDEGLGFGIMRFRGTIALEVIKIERQRPGS
jgi:hypothetical protein